MTKRIRILALIVFAASFAAAQVTNPPATQSSAPLFSTAVTGLTTSTTVNTVLTGPTTMTTPAADGTYRFTMQVSQTTQGTLGTCTLGNVAVDLAYTDADSGVNYAVATTSSVGFHSLNTPAAVVVNMAFNGGANGAATNYLAFPIEFRAKAGTAVQYQVWQQAASNCTNPPVIAVRPALYGPVGY